MTVVILDTETGGFSPARNPLLSVGLLFGKPGEVLEVCSIKIKPPEDTWLEIPIPEDQLKGKNSKVIEKWLNLTTGTLQTPTETKPDLLITAVAAEVNGFVGASETTPGWDLAPARAWGQMSYKDASAELRKQLEKWAPLQATIAHNATFDRDFVATWMPELTDVLPKPWLCTQRTYKARFLGGQQKGSSVGAICKVSGYTGNTGDLHTALGDIRATHHIWSWLLKQGDGTIVAI
jgi:DNA polymerase III epsilon subunit-like protein